MATRTIRGAITVKKDTRQEVLDKTTVMLREIIAQNELKTDDILSVIFTATRDISSAYPAVAARALGITDASLMCVQEMYVAGSLGRCIRAAVTVETDKKQSDMRHIYLEGAVVLRPDLVQKNNDIAVAVDGPAGSGKSTAAKLLAKRYGLLYVDTGAMYRTVGLYCLRNNINADSAEAVGSVIGNIKISLKSSEGMQRIYLDGEDVTDNIRTPEVAAYASKVAVIPAVRAALVDMQRAVAKNNSVIMDGRDIGTNVLKNAEVKVYLDADVHERAKRRVNELAEKGIKADAEKIAAEIAARDENDKNRQCNPLTVADDAVVIDTTGMGIDEVVAAIGSLIEKAKG